MTTTEPAAPAAPGASSPRLDETPKAAAPTHKGITGTARLRDQIDDLLRDFTAKELDQVVVLLRGIKSARGIKFAAYRRADLTARIFAQVRSSAGLCGATTTEKGKSMKIHGPIEIELKVSITDGEVQGIVTIGMGKGNYPTDSELRERVVQFEREEMPDGFRLMTKREWWDTVCPPSYDEDEDGVRHKTRFAVPGGDDYDA